MEIILRFRIASEAGDADKGSGKIFKEKRHSCMQMVLFLIEAQRQAFLYLKERRIQKKETAN